MASKISDDNDSPIADINIVPFVDIILVTLIIFMVTTPFIMKPSIPVNLPKAVSGEETTPSTLTITVTAKGEIVINGKPGTIEEVKSMSAEAAQKNPMTQAVIAADQDVAHGKVISVIDAVKSAGITKFAISIEKPKK